MRRWLVAGTEPMNRGLREARGAWIAPLDHDDAWEPDHVEVLLAHARETRAELVYGKLRVRDAESGCIVPNVVGAWPLSYGQFGFQGALHHAGLRRFEVDPHARLAGEPGDWNLARRMWDAGVRFAFLDRIVTTYYWAPVDPQGQAWLAEALREDP
jgi:glycosyltransferase involved in cell wall biosynthesis